MPMCTPLILMCLSCLQKDRAIPDLCSWNARHPEQALQGPTTPHSSTTESSSGIMLWSFGSEAGSASEMLSTTLQTAVEFVPVPHDTGLGNVPDAHCLQYRHGSESHILLYRQEPRSRCRITYDESIKSVVSPSSTDQPLVLSVLSVILLLPSCG